MVTLVGVVSFGHTPLALPAFATSEFQEFFRLGTALRVTLPTGGGGVVHLFVICGHQGRRRTLRSWINLLLIAGDLNADLAVIPCLSKGISTGRLVDLALAYSLGAGKKPDAHLQIQAGGLCWISYGLHLGLLECTCRFHGLYGHG